MQKSFTNIYHKDFLDDKGVLDYNCNSAYNTPLFYELVTERTKGGAEHEKNVSAKKETKKKRAWF